MSNNKKFSQEEKENSTKFAIMGVVMALAMVGVTLYLIFR